MKDVVLKVEANVPLSHEETLLLFQKEIDDFDRFMQGLKNPLQQGALTKPERVLLLTYLMQKYAGHLEGGS